MVSSLPYCGARVELQADSDLCADRWVGVGSPRCRAGIPPSAVRDRRSMPAPKGHCSHPISGGRACGRRSRCRWRPSSGYPVHLRVTKVCGVRRWLPGRSAGHQPGTRARPAVITPSTPHAQPSAAGPLCGRLCFCSPGPVPGCRHPGIAVRRHGVHGRGIPAHPLGYALLTARDCRRLPAIAPALSSRRMPRMGGPNT